jgi:hypothetical protein
MLLNVAQFYNVKLIFLLDQILNLYFLTYVLVKNKEAVAVIICYGPAYHQADP